MTGKGEQDDELNTESGNCITSDNCDIDINDVPVSDIPMVEEEIPVNVGWICPICKYGISPFSAYCPCRD